jgi:hypothetical protein
MFSLSVAGRTSHAEVFSGHLDPSWITPTRDAGDGCRDVIPPLNTFQSRKVAPKEASRGCGRARATRDKVSSLSGDDVSTPLPPQPLRPQVAALLGVSHAVANEGPTTTFSSSTWPLFRKTRALVPTCTFRTWCRASGRLAAPAMRSATPTDEHFRSF